MYRFAQSLTEKPIKGMLTGPYTMVDWSFDEHYPSRRDAMLAMAEALHQEVAALEKEGARYIQIDEPAVSTRPEEMDLAIEAMGVVTDGIKATTITHVCYGDFDKIYPAIQEMPVDVFDLEFANSDFDLLHRIREHPFTKGISVGVLDVHVPDIEDQATVEGWIRKTLEVIPPEKVWISPDCGLKTRTPDEAEKKLAVMVAAVRRIRDEI
jgi:5-methyltetrahydropteroyltriglutamate--homocysteine methyltransferase